MTSALVVGASGGIGAALVAALEGWQVTALSRSANKLDITDPASVSQVMRAQTGPFDLVICATGALEIDGYAPEKALKSVTAEGLAAQYALNAIGPLMVLQNALPLMAPNATFAALSARVGSIGDNALGGWYAYRAAKAGLNQLIHTAAIELKRTHPGVTAVCLHPGTVATKFTEKYLGRHPSVPPAEAAQNLLRVISGLGPEHSGRFFDWQGAEVPW